MASVTHSIGKLAKAFGVSSESLRNWERQKLIPPSVRTPGGHRRYTPDHVTAIALLLKVDAPVIAVEGPNA